MDESKDKTFRAKVFESGNSLAVVIKKTDLEYLGLKDKVKKGTFIDVSIKPAGEHHE